MIGATCVLNGAGQKTVPAHPDRTGVIKTGSFDENFWIVAWDIYPWRSGFYQHKKFIVITGMSII